MNIRRQCFIIGLFSYSLGLVQASCISIYDIDVLSKGEKTQLRGIVESILSDLKVNRSEICVQIDFIDELPSRESGFTEEGKRILSRSYYDRWASENNQSPAALVLFLKEEGSFRLVSFVVNGLLEERVPGLVSRFIRDEVMKNKTDYGQMIEAGIKALAKALDPIYIERLKTQHIKLFSGNQYKRRHAWDQTIPMNYYAFEPNHIDHPTTFGEGTSEAPDLTMVNNDLYFQWSGIPYINTEQLDISNETKEGRWYENVLLKQFRVPVLREIIDHPRTASENVDKITAEFRKDLITIAKDPFHMDHDHNDLPVLDELGQANLFSAEYFPEYRWRIMGCRVQVKKLTMDKAWEYIPDVINRAIYPDWGGKGPTWCNQYVRDLSARIYGRPIFESMSANKLYDNLSSNPDFIKLELEEPWKYIDSGFLVLFVRHGGKRSGHVETGLPKNINTINADYQSFNTGQEKRYTVGAGSTMGAKWDFVDNKKFKRFLYLGFLKK